MKLWPVIIDSQPPYLGGTGRSSSLLLAPVGTNTLIQLVMSALSPITDTAPVVVAPGSGNPRYAEWIQAVCPSARVVETPAAFTDALRNHELSDALLFIDPRCMPSQGFHFSSLVGQYAVEPRVAHHLVAFERGVAGTRERVCFDTAGQVRGIQRFYDHATWPFIAGITAMLVPCACGVA